MNLYPTMVRPSKFSDRDSRCWPTTISFRGRNPDSGERRLLDYSASVPLPRLGKESVSLLSFTSYNLHSNIIILNQQYGISPIQTTMLRPLEEPIHAPSIATPSEGSKEGEHDPKQRDVERIPPLEAVKQVVPNDEESDVIEVDSGVMVPYFPLAFRVNSLTGT